VNPGDKMAWHLNLEHGYYSTRVPKNPTTYLNQFGIKDGKKKILLGNIDFNLVEMEKDGLIKVEKRKKYYRIIIWYDKPNFYLSTTRGNQNRKYLDFTY
jgi:hypothetical protein